jgi:hypothetical protein
MFSTISCQSATNKQYISEDSLKQIPIKEVLVIGKKQTNSASIRKEMLGMPVKVRSDNIGNVYIADMMSMSIKVFSNTGLFIREIGKRGKAPCEFSDISAMTIDQQSNNLIVVDHFNARLSVFSNLGNILSTHTIDYSKVMWPRDIQVIDSNYLINSYNETQNPFVLHELNNTLQVNIANVLDVNEITESNNEFAKEHIKFDSGRFWVVGLNVMYYVPSIYNGVIFKLEKNQDHWAISQKISGIQHERGGSEFLGKYEFSSQPELPKGALSINLPSGTYHGVINSFSLGLFTNKKNDLINFSLYSTDKHRLLVVEIFGSDGVLKDRGVIKKYDKNVLLKTVDIHWIDSLDRFYMTDMTKEPIVSIFEIEY